MQDSKDEGHTMILDCGSVKHHLNCKNRYEMERWVEAITISMNTDRESKLSLTGACKNISLIVAQFDHFRESLKRQIEEDLSNKLSNDISDWEMDVDNLI